MIETAHRHLTSIILAAGQSSRMKTSKIILLWGEHSVIGNIILAFQKAGISEIVVVTGGYREMVETEVKKYNIQTIYNPNFKNGEMAVSLQTGMELLDQACDGIFIALGDQPEIDPSDLQEMIEQSRNSPEKLIIPSYNMRRGHPWLVPEKYFNEIKGLRPPETMRSFIQSHQDEIVYYVVKNSGILTDLDTPEDYQRLKPK